MLTSARCFQTLLRTRRALALFVGSSMLATTLHAQGMPKLAPGVLRVVESLPEEQDTVSGPSPLVGLAAQAPDWQPHFAPASETLASIANAITLRRTVWQLEFAYKPMRMITIQSRGQTKRVWYLVYRVTNTGRHLRPTPSEDDYGHDKYGVELVSKSVRFMPTFALRSHESGAEYRDQVLPAAVRRIHKIEIRDPNVSLHDSVSISTLAIRPSTEAEDNSVWGVATWVDVDPTIDFFSVFVQGLTNAYDWNPEAESEELRYSFKTLQLNFWRPGDAVLEHQGEFRVGLPYIEDPVERSKLLSRYGIDEVQDYLWVYR